ncbi:MAG: hypothetical protein WKG07_36020 [Hymenobacter sp.]
MATMRRTDGQGRHGHARRTERAEATSEILGGRAAPPRSAAGGDRRTGTPACQLRPARGDRPGERRLIGEAPDQRLGGRHGRPRRPNADRHDQGHHQQQARRERSWRPPERPQTDRRGRRGSIGHDAPPYGA